MQSDAFGSPMQDDAFARLVAEDVKNKVSHGQRDYLRLPENWENWKRALVMLIDNLNGQLKDLEEASRRTEEQYADLGDDGTDLIESANTEYATRIKKINRFKFHVEGRLDEVSRMISMGADKIDDRMKTVEFLRRAIQKHRELIDNYEMDYSEVDEALWAALDGNWQFDQTELLLEEE